MDNRPIGVFDSGFGGLTVLYELSKLLKNESIVYFGDNGRAPYGTKSKEIVIKYTFQDINFLLNQDVKMIVIACNTASACSLSKVKNCFDIPLIEVVEPGALSVAKTTKNKKVGIIGTTATINSGVYERAIKKINDNIEIFVKACPLFVPLVEEGWWENDIVEMIAKEYLNPLKKQGIDTLVLGCTHYPLLEEIIKKVMGEDVILVSSALEIAKSVKELIKEKNIERDSEITPVYRYYTSDCVDKFENLGQSILKQKIYSVQKVDIEKY